MKNLFLNAAWSKPTERPPVWMMRQAGRFMKEYWEIKNKYSFLEMCKTPEIAADVTMLPIDLLDVDAAILFSDILVTAEAMGGQLSFEAGVGPTFANPVRSETDINALLVDGTEDRLKYVADAIKVIQQRLNGTKPLIGFAGAPFTVMSYLIEGGSSKDFKKTKLFIHNQPLLAHKLLQELATLRRENSEITYLRPDAKSQVTLEYNDDNQPVRIDSIVISTQHDDFDEETKMLAKIKKDIIEILIPRVIAKNPQYAHLFNDAIKYHINPTGKFVIGGPHGDTGLTGRKIIVDTYGGKGAHGGGAFSGKDPSKVDRSAAYATRHIAKNLVAAGVADEILVQVSYAIGVAEPTSINVNTYGTAKVKLTDGEISKVVESIFDMRPYFIEQRLKLRNPIYSETAAIS